MGQRWHYIVIVSVLVIAYLAYLNAMRAKALADDHAHKIANANAMVGFAGKIITYVLG